MIGMSALGEFAVAMLGLDVVLYEPVSRLGGASSLPATPQLFPSIASGTILTDDDGEVLTDDDAVVMTDNGA